MCPAMLGINLADNPSAVRQVQRIRQDSCKYAKHQEREQRQPWQPHQHEGGHHQRRKDEPERSQRMHAPEEEPE